MCLELNSAETYTDSQAQFLPAIEMWPWWHTVPALNDPSGACVPFFIFGWDDAFKFRSTNIELPSRFK